MRTTELTASGFLIRWAASRDGSDAILTIEGPDRKLICELECSAADLGCIKADLAATIADLNRWERSDEP